MAAGSPAQEVACEAILLGRTSFLFGDVWAQSYRIIWIQRAALFGAARCLLVFRSSIYSGLKAFYPTILFIRGQLATEDDLFLVAEATNGDEAQTICCEYQPDVLLLDLHMPGP